MDTIGVAVDAVLKNDWYASAFDTITDEDTAASNISSVTVGNGGECDMILISDTYLTQCAQLSIKFDRFFDTGDATHDVALSYRKFRIGAGWNLYST